MTAEETAAGWFNRIGDGWPVGLSMSDPALAPLLDGLGEQVAAALDTDDVVAVEAAFAEFRRGFGPIWRAWQQGNKGEVA